MGRAFRGRGSPTRKPGATAGASPDALVSTLSAQIMTVVPETGVGLAKDVAYYENDRADLVALLPRPLGRVLDIGCGGGGVGRLLRAEGAELLVGVELEAEVAERARAIYDDVHVGSAQDVVPALQGEFDTVLCYDVLEHLLDPWAVLRSAHDLLVPGGHLHVSVPNARHVSLAYDIYVRGTFGYTAWGHRDNTHLRWFTPRDMGAALEAAGFEVVSHSHPPLSAPSRALARLTRGRSVEFLVGQWYVLARRPRL